ncbi:MAG: RIP metalloprotease RseP [Methylobacteriaceae bacterium]|nr:RIP metalloprotease RseP [Methylobacteriaceae bacterium]
MSLGVIAESLAWAIPAFIFVLTVVVFFHELGHFLVGRWCGVKVEAFSVGFGPELFGFTDRRGTRWRFAALPLGGYVKFHGDANGASMPDNEALAAMPASQRAVSFYGQPVWKRAAIVAAGPAANFLLAIVIFASSFYLFGRTVIEPRVAGVQAGSVAESSGFRAGDLVLSIDGRPVKSFVDLTKIIGASAEQPLTFEVARDGVRQIIKATPERKDIKTPFGLTRVGRLGVQASNSPADLRVERYGLGESVALAAEETWYVVERTGAYVAGLVRGKETVEQISGPLRIAEVSGAVARVGLDALLSLAAIVSISIGLINLAPIPLLDGGHLMFYAIEALRGRPLSERSQELGFRVGLALVVMLMLFATSNDVLHLISKAG